MSKQKKSKCLRECSRFTRSHSGQAALEFLTTYAWAFIVIAIVIAAIAYFGILKPSKILPDRCTFNVGIGCEAYKIGSDGTFNLRLKNGVGKVITVTAITLSTESATAFSCSNLPDDDPATGGQQWPVNWASGVIKGLTWSGCNPPAVGFIAGDKGKILVKITYYDVTAGTTYSQTADGEVFTTVS